MVLVPLTNLTSFHRSLIYFQYRGYVWPDYTYRPRVIRLVFEALPPLPALDLALGRTE